MDWDVKPGEEGRPCINGDRRYVEYFYEKYSDEDFEPFMYVRNFKEIPKQNYVDISEEFVLYFNLFEEIKENKQNRIYYSLKGNKKEEVIRIVNNKVSINYKYLLEYISIRSVNFIMCFYFENEYDKDIKIKQMIDGSFKATIIPGWNIWNKDYKEDTFLGRITIIKFENDYDKIRTEVRGKKLIVVPTKDIEKYHFEDEYEKFIVDIDNEGKEIERYCNDSDSEYFDYMVFFKRKLLDKYYDEPAKYTIGRHHIKCNDEIEPWCIKLDNDSDNSLMVHCLKDLRMLPFEEQKYWKLYNILKPYDYKISCSYANWALDANWNNAPLNRLDLDFREAYIDFNEKWYQKYNWYFYKTLKDEDKHYLTGIRQLESNNIKIFKEQIESLALLLVGRMNVEKIKNEIKNTEEKYTTFTLLEKYLQSKIEDNIVRQLITFLKNLQELRSTYTTAHGTSYKNEKIKLRKKQFGIDKEDNTDFVKIYNDILLNSIKCINTLKTLTKEN